MMLLLCFPFRRRAGLALLGLAGAWPVLAQEKVTFNDHLLPLIESHCAKRSDPVFTFAASRGRVKLGQPVPDSYLSSELNNTSPDTTST